MVLLFMTHSKVNVKLKKELVEAELVGVFQYSEVIPPSPMLGGHTGGVIAYPVAVVKHDDKLKQVRLTDVEYIVDR